MKFIIMDYCNGDLFTSEYNDKETAIKESEKQFARLTESDKAKRDSFYLLESVNPDEESENHFDGEVIKEWI